MKATRKKADPVTSPPDTILLELTLEEAVTLRQIAWPLTLKTETAGQLSQETTRPLLSALFRALNPIAL